MTPKRSLESGRTELDTQRIRANHAEAEVAWLKHERDIARREADRLEHVSRLQLRMLWDQREDAGILRADLFRAQDRLNEAEFATRPVLAALNNVLANTHNVHLSKQVQAIADICRPPTGAPKK